MEMLLVIRTKACHLSKEICLYKDATKIDRRNPPRNRDELR
jgi:hypothetical protein